jgi:hypothetical protein
MWFENAFILGTFEDVRELPIVVQACISPFEEFLDKKVHHL